MAAEGSVGQESHSRLRGTPTPKIVEQAQQQQSTETPRPVAVKGRRPSHRSRLRRRTEAAYSSEMSTGKTVKAASREVRGRGSRMRGLVPG